MSGEVQVKFKLLLLRLSKGLCMGPGKVRLSMVRWSSEAQVTELKNVQCQLVFV